MSDTTSRGYFDIQINGFGGVDFNQDHLTAQDLHKACLALQADGMETVLATIITEHIDQMALRLRRLVELREQDPLARQVIAGVHIEGPFINEQPGYRGAHPPDAIHPADLDEMKRLLDAADGLTRLVTLAPERDAGLKLTRMLVQAGIKVSAGHCNPTLDELDAAIDAGVSLFTHLGNGCPMQMHRHDNIIQRALSRSDRLWLCFIADGVHVPFFALRNYLKCADVSRCIVTTDAMAAAGLGPGRYNLGRWDVLIGPDLAARAPDGSHLIGSAMSMTKAMENLVQHVGLTPADALRLTRDNPRRAIPQAG